MRADDLGQEAGKDPDGAERSPRLWEPSHHRLSVPIRRAIGLAGYFICVYLSVCLCLALSSDVSVSQPSDAPSAGASISKDRHSPHLSPGGQPGTRTGHGASLPLWETVPPNPPAMRKSKNSSSGCTALYSLHFLVPRVCLILSLPCSQRSSRH